MNNEYKNLNEWCQDYSKKTGVKIYAQSAPLQLVLEDVVGRINNLEELVLEFQTSNNEKVESLLETINTFKELLNHKKLKNNLKYATLELQNEQ